MSREDVSRVLKQWQEFVSDRLASCPSADGSLVLAVIRWLDKNVDDFDEDMADAVELFQRRKKIGPYTPK